MISLFCRIASLLQGSFAKETYNLIDPTNRSHPIQSSGVVDSGEKVVALVEYDSTSRVHDSGGLCTYCRHTEVVHECDFTSRYSCTSLWSTTPPAESTTPEDNKRTNVYKTITNICIHYYMIICIHNFSVEELWTLEIESLLQGSTTLFPMSTTLEDHISFIGTIESYN